MKTQEDTQYQKDNYIGDTSWGIISFLFVGIMVIGKLIGGWSIPWVWVFFPVWLPFAVVAVFASIFICIFVLLGVAMVIIAAIDTAKKRK